MTREGEGKTALITGASAGLGAWFARVFAEQGFGVVLVARRKDRLDQIARDVAEEYGVNTHVISSDLAKLDAPIRLFETLEDQDLTPHVLVNNAGLGLNDSFSDLSWLENRDFIHLMGTNVAHLCHLAIPKMRQANYGRILNVASVAAFIPGDAGSLYRAVKAFVVHLSTSLHADHKHENIHCTALCPGLTYTEFHEVMGVQEAFTKRFPKFLWLDAEKVTRQGYQAVMRGESVYINGWIYKLIARCARTISF